MHWLISANSEVYDHASSFKDHGFIDWRQGTIKYQNLDTVYIYVTKPVGRIQYKCIITKTNLNSKEIRDDIKYWTNQEEHEKSLLGVYMRLELVEQINSPKLSLERLLKHGLRAAPQGPKKLDKEPKLLNYIEKSFYINFDTVFFPDEIDSSLILTEGLKKQIFVNRYERSKEARDLCIKHHGTTCNVCKIDLSMIYGDVAKGFIHVHHLVPISDIGEEYKVNYKTDLLPVCPNCHAMLHRIKSKEPVLELRKIINSNLKRIQTKKIM